ncbi:MAG TPA: hypothetical protein VFJ17_08890 [Mycobacteriales bacterium]|nr:hypothetical protein [Mycobacteriales bacterium]
MAHGKRARHAQSAPWRERLPLSPTTLALVSLAAVFIVAGALTLHVLSVPSHLRQEGAGAPSPTAQHSVAASHVRPLQSRAARTEQRSTSPTPSPTTATPAGVTRTSPTPTPTTTSSRPSPRPSPSSSSSRPLPLPTLTGPGHH